MESETKGIYRKISSIMEDVQYLAKDDQVSFGDVNYKGLSEEKVTRVMREALVKYDVIVFPIEQSHHREGKLSTVDVTYRLVDVADGSYIDVVSSGTGADTQDKGVGKAMTYAFKYMWLRTFALPTGEDPDKISSAELDQKDAEAAIDKGKRRIMQMLEDNPGLSSDYRHAITADIDEAFSKKDVEGMRRIYRDVEKETLKLGAQLAKEHNEEPPLPDGIDLAKEVKDLQRDFF